MKRKLGIRGLVLVGIFALLQWPPLVYSKQDSQYNAEYPQPDGKFRVGIHQFELTKEQDWIQVTAWYPSESALKAQPANYVPAAIASILKTRGFPESEYKGIPPSWSFIDLPVASGKHPVLIYNHGFGTFPRQNMTRFEYLASHGYIVLAVGHPGDTLAIERKSGGVVHQLTEVANRQIDEDDLAALIASLKRMASATSQTEWKQELKNALISRFSRGFVNRFGTWYSNNLMLIDTLSELQSGTVPTPFQGHMDLDAIGSFGHSYGGNISVILANQIPEIKAGVNFDGAQYDWPMDAKLQVPACFFYSAKGESFPGLNDALFTEPASVCSLIFHEANHMSFTDLTYKMPDESGKVTGAPIGQAVNATLKAFFDAKLKHSKSWPPASSVHYTLN